MILSLLLACGPGPEPVGDRSATLVYTTNVDGEIEPCG